MLLSSPAAAAQPRRVSARRRGIRSRRPGRDVVRHRHGSLYEPERGEQFWRAGAGARARAARAWSRPASCRRRCRSTFNFSTSEMRVDSRTYSEGQRGEIIENTRVAGLPRNARRADHRRPRPSTETDIAGSPTWWRGQPDHGAHVLAERIGASAIRSPSSTARTRARTGSSA